MTATARKPEVVVVSGSTVVTDVHATLDGCWTSNNHVPEDIRVQLGIAVGELVANIVEHAAQDEPVLVQMSIDVLANEVHVSFTDDGIPCPVAPESADMPDVFADRGRGLAMMRAVLGRLSYQRANNHNHWRLVSRPFG